MTELRLRYDGNGKFSPASHVDYTAACDECQQGEEYVAKLVRPRSSRENRLFHGAIKSAYHNQRGGPRFDDRDDSDGWERLRGWLLCEADWCDIHRFKPGALAPEAITIMRQVVRADTVWAVDRTTGDILMKVPRSIKFATMKHPDFQPVKNKVFEILCNEIVPGSTPEQLMEIGHARGDADQLRQRADHSNAGRGDAVRRDRSRARKDDKLLSSSSVEA